MNARFTPFRQRHGAAPIEGEVRHEWEGSNTLDRQIDEARALMGEEAWARYQREWANG